MDFSKQHQQHSSENHHRGGDGGGGGGSGFQNPISPNPNPNPTCDPTTLDPPPPICSSNDDDDELNQVNQQLLQNLSFKGEDEEEEVSSLVSAPATATEEERDLKHEGIDVENYHQFEMKEAVSEEALQQVESSNLVIDGEKIAADNVVPRDLSGCMEDSCDNEALEKSRNTKNCERNDEEIDSVEVDDKGKIEREFENCNVLDENAAGNNEPKEGGSDKNGSTRGEVGDEEGNGDIKVKENGTDQGVVDDYENDWSGPENGEDNVKRIESKEVSGIFDRYGDGRSANEQDGEGSNGYGNVEGDAWDLKDGEGSGYHYPLRPDAEDCSFYMRTGMCKFGSNCKFNHPLKRRNQATKETIKQKEENSDRLGQTECKYYLTSGGCKYGKACRYNHSRGKTAVAQILEFNFLGLPIRKV